LPILSNPRHEKFAQALARGMSASAAYVEAGFKPHRPNAALMARKENFLARVAELQQEQLSLHQQATVEAAAAAKVTIESLIAEMEAARRAFPRRVVPLLLSRPQLQKPNLPACGARRLISITQVPSTSALSG
jgi:phage terminase small subunit